MSSAPNERRAPVTLVYRRRLTEEWLREHYLNQQESTEQLGRRAGVSAQTIRRALRRHGIELRPKKSDGVPYSLGDLLTEPFLHQAYELEGRTAREIAQDVGCSEAAVWARLRRYGIPRRGVQHDDRLYLKRFIDTDLLRTLWHAGDTAESIARTLGVDHGTVTAYAQRLGLQRPSETDVAR